MNRVPTIICEWKRCLKPASEHVCYGLRAFGDDGRAADVDVLSYITEHSDLCALHSLRVVDTYVYSTVTALGECPARRSAARAIAGSAMIPQNDG